MPMATVEEQREYQRKWKSKIRADWFRGKVCEICGSGKELELDHIDPTTKVSHNIWSWSLTRRLEELAKCRPLCKNCHKERTIKQQQKPLQHGTNSGYCYRRNPCRCVLCCQAHSDYLKMYRAKKKQRS